MDKTKYREWDYDNEEIITYEREGECNSCGECCRTVIRFGVSNMRGGINRDGGYSTDGKDVWAEIENDGERRYYKVMPVDHEEFLICGDLITIGGEYSCGVHFNKADICNEWPMVPQHVDSLPMCSYKFYEVARHKIDELDEKEKEE